MILVGLVCGAVCGYVFGYLRSRTLRRMNTRLRRRNLVLTVRLGRLGICPEPPVEDPVRIHVNPGRFA